MGKFYRYDDKDHEVSPDEVSKQTAGTRSNIGVASCGRPDSVSGAEGSYDIYDGDTKVCYVYRSCPWG